MYVLITYTSFDATFIKSKIRNVDEISDDSFSKKKYEND